MFNNKGQSLVTFVMVLPVLLLVLILVMDVGKMYLVRRELDNINYITLDYALDNIENELIDSKMVEIILKNDEEIKIINNRVEDNNIYLELEKKYEGYFLGLVSERLVRVKSSYIGYKKEDKKYIERVK